LSVAQDDENDMLLAYWAWESRGEALASMGCARSVTEIVHSSVLLIEQLAL